MMISTLSAALSRLSVQACSPLQVPKAFASGRWWPQPLISSCNWYSSETPEKGSQIEKEKGNSLDFLNADRKDLTSLTTQRMPIEAPQKHGDVELSREKAAPIYAPSKYGGLKVYGTVRGEKGEVLADYVLFEDSIQKAKVPWVKYNHLSSAERTIYLAHLKAIKQRKLSYKDPETGFTVMTISQLLLNGKCCGCGCRHCPYEHEKVNPVRKKNYELSRHRSRPPCPGIHRRTRLLVVDNSDLGKEANMSGKLAYCIYVYKQGYRKKHMPHATLGDKVLVAIRGEMRKAFVVGANIHVLHRKHGVPSTDTNNIVLLDEEGNPLGTRIVAPIPSKLLLKRDRMQFSKVLALATKFV